MADYYNTLMLSLAYGTLMTPDQRFIMEEVLAIFKERFSVLKDGGLTFSDGSTWHPTVFTNTRGLDY